jgi:TonB-dependent receptor
MSVNPILAANNSIEEKTNAAYMQVELDGQLGSLTTHTRAGIRYEKTDVVSTSVITPASAIEWQANNDFRIVPGSASDAVTVSGKHSYSYILPNLDFSVDLTADLKARVSFGQSIARSPWSNLYAGATPTQPNGSTLISSATRGGGNATNPALDPIESDNLDLALEWYFADSSFVQVTYWNKRVDNFIGNSVVEQNLFGLTDPTAGPDAQAAAAFLASGACESQVTAAGGDPSTSCALTDTTLFVATAMLRNAATSGGLDAYDGSGAQVQAIEAAYQLYGEADDPLYMFNVNTPINQNAAKLHGWELGGQYFFGDTGFGILANYTIVDGDVNFNNAGDPGVDQFALLGLSDTANAVLMYEKYGWSARLAWNWRDEYLILANQGGSRNPFYVEAYDQFDLAVNYAFNDHLSVGVEAINITGEDVRWHARSEAQLVRLVDQSPRYAVGVRYKF